ncbi:MAG TPA: serine hydrolase [Fulvivirga sp.]|nr:serine hydrolase [Fulvivirga sp.]
MDSDIDTLLISQLVSSIQTNKFKNIDALLIVKDGKLVLDEYFNGYDKNKKHKLWSCTKSFSSALIGIAIDEGQIRNENDSIIEYLGTYANKLNESQNAITIKNVLEMGTGLEWNGDLTESGRKLPYAEDMVNYTLELPQEFKPGTKFQYSSANSMLLAPIIYNATGQQANEFAKNTLFKELGIENYEWNKQAEFWTKTAGDEIPAKKPNISYESNYAELTNTATGLWMTPRDMSKLGQLYLNKGKWENKQIISESWIKKSTTEQISGSDYGLHWKLIQIGEYQSFYASGFGLQRIFVIPKLNTVIVFTQNWYQNQPKGNKQMMKILEEYIIKAIKSA